MPEEEKKIERKPDYDLEEGEDEEGLASLFGKWSKEKLKSGKKKRMAEVD